MRRILFLRNSRKHRGSTGGFLRSLAPCAAALALWAALLGAAAGLADNNPANLAFPLQPDSVRFAIIGDSGTGDAKQAAVAAQMSKARAQDPFDFVLMLGDNIYGGHSAEDLKNKFDLPYSHLLSAGVRFFACLGNHDSENERYYAPMGMNGNRYYNFRKGNAEFFALDSNYMDPGQMDWLRQRLSSSSARWKICYFHHPLYSDARFHGPDLDLRQRLEPILRQFGADVVFSGHEHVYERLRPQNGIYYFVLGNSGELRPHDLRPSPETVKGFDTGRAFAMFEIAGDQMYFETISENGDVVDSAVLPKVAR